MILCSASATPTCAGCWNVSGRDCKCEQLLEMGHMSLYYLQYDKAKVTKYLQMITTIQACD